MPLAIIKLGRVPIFRTARSVRFSFLHNKRSLSSSSQADTDADPGAASGGEAPINASLPGRVRALEEGASIISSKVDAGFERINDRFDAFDRKFDRIDTEIDGWVKWGFRIGLGLVGAGVLAIWDAKKEMHQNQKEIHLNQKETHQNQKEMQKFIRDSITKSEGRLGSKIKESEEKLESKLMLAFVREVKENVRVELQHVVGKTQK